MKNITKLAGLGTLLAGAANQLSPKPGSLVIRTAFTQDANRVAKAMDRTAPLNVSVERSIQYAHGSEFHDKKNTALDIVRTKKEMGKKLPVVIWIHGGGWLSGSSTDVTPYLKHLVSPELAAVSLNYSLIPEKDHQTQIDQVNTALEYLQDNQDRFDLDMDNVIIAGDSAGAQITSEIALLTTNPEVAKERNFTPALKPEALAGLILHCGVYDLPRMLSSDSGSKLLTWGYQQEAWALTGKKSNNLSHKTLQTMSTMQYDTNNFPPVLISGGNADGLTEPQSKEFAKVLEENGVDVTAVFFDKANPPLPHEYQFHFQYEEAKEMLEITNKWLSTQLSLAQTHLD